MVEGGALVAFTHTGAISVVGGAFDRTGPETLKYNMIAILSCRRYHPEFLHLFDSEMAEGPGAQHIYY